MLWITSLLASELKTSDIWSMFLIVLSRTVCVKDYKSDEFVIDFELLMFMFVTEIGLDF